MNEIPYHLLNRGIEKRNIFLEEEDYLRFVHNFIDFNTTESKVHQSYQRRRLETQTELDSSEDIQLVDLLSWCLMPNHPHIMVYEKMEKAAGCFSRKVFGGYTKYFNEKHERSGVLFQGKTKIIPVEKEAHFLYLPFYIHLNPLDLFQKNWKEDGIKDVKAAMRFLEQYRWSNYRDIIGLGDGEFSKIANKELFFEIFETDEMRYKKELEEWMRNDGYREDFELFE